MFVAQSPGGNTALISFVSAFVVLIVTQIVLHFREEKKLHREKLEKLFEGLNDFAEANNDRVRLTFKAMEDHGSETADYIPTSVLFLHPHLNRLRALVALYFPSLETGLDEIEKANKVVNQFILESQDRDYKDFEQERFRKLGEDVAKSLYRMWRHSLDERETLVRSMPGLVGSWWRRKCSGE